MLSEIAVIVSSMFVGQRRGFVVREFHCSSIISLYTIEILATIYDQNLIVEGQCNNELC